MSSHLDTDALATAEMLKMFESMENNLSDDPIIEDADTLVLASADESADEPALDITSVTDETQVSELEAADSLMADLDLSPLDMEADDSIDVLAIDDMDLALPATDEAHSIEADVSEELSNESDALPLDIDELDMGEALATEEHNLEDSLAALALPSDEITDVPVMEFDALAPETSLLDASPDIHDEALSLDTSELSVPDLIVSADTDMNALDAAMEPQASATGHAITDQLNIVVQNAVNCLQDWLTIRQASEDKGPQQGLAQLDILLDTVNQQQQQLADQLAASAALNIPALAAALGTSMPTPQAMGWSQEQWREKAEDVSHKTDQIAAMNAKLRKQLEQF